MPKISSIEHRASNKIRGMLRLGLRAMVACGTAILISGCLPLMAASAAGSVAYYNMPHSAKG
jgi:hypothetical protein